MSGRRRTLTWAQANAALCVLSALAAYGFGQGTLIAALPALTAAVVNLVCGIVHALSVPRRARLAEHSDGG